MVRPLAFLSLFAGIAVTLTGSSAGRLTSQSTASPAARVVAWVDFDVEPARQAVAGLRARLKVQRYDDPRPVVLEFVGADVAHPEHLTAEMRQLTSRAPELIIASSVNVARSLQHLPTSAPVYFIIQSDPVRDGLVRSLVPTGRFTGYTFFVPLDVKVMELLRRVFPASRTVGVLADQVWLSGTTMSRDLYSQALALGLNLQVYDLRNIQELGRLLRNAQQRSVQAWYVPYSEMAFDHGAEIAAALAQSGVPAVYARRKFLALGGLLSVQSVDGDAVETWATSIAHILNGVPAATIPIMRPKEIEVAVNVSALRQLDRVTRERLAREATVFE